MLAASTTSLSITLANSCASMKAGKSAVTFPHCFFQVLFWFNFTDLRDLGRGQRSMPHPVSCPPCPSLTSAVVERGECRRSTRSDCKLGNVQIAIVVVS